ncbi:Uncharacterised protein [Vibrio cholerae]|nr:Uncharacterised protein [Vibrio cholerae]
MYWDRRKYRSPQLSQSAGHTKPPLQCGSRHVDSCHSAPLPPIADHGR